MVCGISIFKHQKLSNQTSCFLILLLCSRVVSSCFDIKPTRTRCDLIIQIQVTIVIKSTQLIQRTKSYYFKSLFTLQIILINPTIRPRIVRIILWFYSIEVAVIFGESNCKHHYSFRCFICVYNCTSFCIKSFYFIETALIVQNPIATHKTATIIVIRHFYFT